MCKLCILVFVYESDFRGEFYPSIDIGTNISDVQRTDHGNYRCIVWNKAGRTEAVGHLLVHSEPQLTAEPILSPSLTDSTTSTTYFVGHKPLDISCRVTGYPLIFDRLNGATPEQLKGSGGDLGHMNGNNHPISLHIVDDNRSELNCAKVTPISYYGDKFLGYVLDRVSKCHIFSLSLQRDSKHRMLSCLL